VTGEPSAAAPAAGAFAARFPALVGCTVAPASPQRRDDRRFRLGDDRVAKSLSELRDAAQTRQNARWLPRPPTSVPGAATTVPARNAFARA
jgi:hypothetical protein